MQPLNICSLIKSTILTKNWIWEYKSYFDYLYSFEFIFFLFVFFTRTGAETESARTNHFSVIHTHTLTHTLPQSLEPSPGRTMSPLFSRLSLAAGDGWSVNHFSTAPHCVVVVCVCVSEVVKHGPGIRRGRALAPSVW